MLTLPDARNVQLTGCARPVLVLFSPLLHAMFDPRLQFIDEAERSLHDAIMIVRRALKHAHVVAGGGAIDMEVRRSCNAAAHTAISTYAQSC